MISCKWSNRTTYRIPRISVDNLLPKHAVSGPIKPTAIFGMYITGYDTSEYTTVTDVLCTFTAGPDASAAQSRIQ